METQEDFYNTEIGTKETKKLEPEEVKIVKVEVETIEKANSPKVVCFVKHPQGEREISISSAKMERKGKLEVGGLWFNQDEEGKIKKGSLLANFLSFMGAKVVKELEGKTCKTVEDESGYLVFKGY